MVGTMTAKAIAFAAQKPFLAVNHLEGHALTVRLTDDVAFPYLLLLVSGGHCQVLIVEGVGKYKRIGTTIDDAVGEAFDKTAKMMGLGYPGGPALEKSPPRVIRTGSVCRAHCVEGRGAISPSRASRQPFGLIWMASRSNNRRKKSKPTLRHLSSARWVIP